MSLAVISMTKTADAEDFKILRDSPGWGEITLLQAEHALAQSFRFIPRPDTDYGAGMFATLADLTDGTPS